MLWCGEGNRGGRGEEKTSTPIVQIIYVLKTANSKGKKFKPLVQVSQGEPLPSCWDGLWNPSPWSDGERADHGHPAVLTDAAPSPCLQLRHQNQVVSRLLVTLIVPYLCSAFSSNNCEKRFFPCNCEKKFLKNANNMKSVTPRYKQEPYVDLSWEICKYRLELIQSTCC